MDKVNDSGNLFITVCMSRCQFYFDSSDTSHSPGIIWLAGTRFDLAGYRALQTAV